MAAATAAAPADATPIAVSLKARGLALGGIGGGGGGGGGTAQSSGGGGSVASARARAAAAALAADLGDVSVAMAVNVLTLGAGDWASVAVTVVSLLFFVRYQGGAVVFGVAQSSLVLPLAFLIYLPTLAIALLAALRRFDAAARLDELQGHAQLLYALHGALGGCGAPGLLAQLDDALSDAMVQTLAYVSAPRHRFVRHFSAHSLRAGSGRLPPGCDLARLGRDIGQRLRRVHNALRRVSAAASALLQHCTGGAAAPAAQRCAPAALALLQGQAQLATTAARLASAKDLRAAPLLLRATLVPGVCVVHPLLAGAWLAGLAGGPGASAASAVFAIVVGCMLQVLLASLLRTSLALEDPFDAGPESGADTLSALEANAALAYLTAPPDSHGGALQEEQAAGAAGSGGGSGGGDGHVGVTLLRLGGGGGGGGGGGDSGGCAVTVPS